MSEAAEISAQDAIIFDMLGEQLSTAIKGARAKTGDASITVRIERGLCIVVRAGTDVQGGLGMDAAAAMLAELN